MIMIVIVIMVASSYRVRVTGTVEIYCNVAFIHAGCGEAGAYR
jgi:hypothetical protein